MLFAPPWCANYIGIPFAYRGRTRKGLDCWGLVHLVMREHFHIDVPSYDDVAFYEEENGCDTTHERVLAVSQSIQEAAEQWKRDWHQVQKPQAGDVVLFRNAGEPSHVGLMVDASQFLHVEEGVNSLVESVSDRLWCRRVDGYWRHCSA